MKTKKINISSLDIHYLDNEIISEHTLLFIHGNSSNKESFAKQFTDPVLQNFRMVALDLPGHGQSTHPCEARIDHTIYTYVYFTNILYEFVKALELSNCVFIGHSLGGHLSISLSRKISPSGVVISQTPPLNEIADSLKGFSSTHNVIPILYNPKAPEEEKEFVFNVFAASSELKEKIRASWAETAPEFRVNFMSNMLSSLVPREIDQLKGLKCPVLILESSDDLAINHDYFTSNEFLRSLMVEIPNTRHFPHFESAPEYNHQLKLFLETL